MSRSNAEQEGFNGQNKGKHRSHKTAPVPGGRATFNAQQKLCKFSSPKGDHSSSGVTKNLKVVTKIYFHDQNYKLGY